MAECYYRMSRKSSSSTQLPFTLATGCLRLFLESFLLLLLLVRLLSSEARAGILHGNTSDLKTRTLKASIQDTHRCKSLEPPYA